MKTSSTQTPQESGNGGSVAPWLAQARFGPPQTFRDIVVWPLFLPAEPGPSYRTLDEAVTLGTAQVTEVSESGSVPQLKVINQSPDPLLILDGEELIGAKQNRVVNTTLLLPARSETVIPVSCTEQGRWRHTSHAFSSSEVVRADEAQVREFLFSAAQCPEERFPAVGHGESVRLHNGRTAGAALLHEGTVEAGSQAPCGCLTSIVQFASLFPHEILPKDYSQDWRMSAVIRYRCLPADGQPPKPRQGRSSRMFRSGSAPYHCRC